ncbi:MAG: tRNA lysidine(34) synthetase TilS [Burkholderiales bacterium]
MHTVVEVVDRTLDAHQVKDCPVCIALSGGIDSVVLLSVLDELAAGRELRLSAVHVNHGLSAHALRWEEFCRLLCAKRGLPLVVEKVRVSRDSGLGLEAAARVARYSVFSQQSANYLALAHHLDDQIETFLIQLLRGAGASGLSAMPVLRDYASAFGKTMQQGPALLRPMLQVPRAAIADFARPHGLQWVEDESNEDVSLDRNFLRREVLPLIAARFPAYRETVSRAAKNLTDVASLADALARIDAQAAGVDAGLDIAFLRALAPPRALNVLRHLFSREGLEPPRRRALEEALRQSLAARCDSQMRVDFGQHSLRRFRDRIFLVRNATFPVGWCAQWRGEPRIALPNELGLLRFALSAGTGFSSARISSAPVSIRPRQGGERISLAHNRPHRDLRHLFQEAGIAPWERNRIPLVFCGTALACVPGIGVAAEFQARPGEAAICVTWERAEAHKSARPEGPD